MKKGRSSKLSTYLILALTIMGAACSSSGNGGNGSGGGTSSTDTTTQYSEPTGLSAADNGGYSSSNEEPYFGLDSMKEFGADTSTSALSVSALDLPSTAQTYEVRIVWGNLQLDARNDIVTGTVDHLDWSGSLSYDGNATVAVDHTILFDLNDSLNAQVDPASVSWTSHTGPHVDGIMAKVTVTPGLGTDSLTFNTAVFSKTILLADLDHFNEIDTLDSDGHGVSFTIIRTDNEACAEGFIEGKYHARPVGDGGIFRGRVLSDTGELDGHVRGHFGVTSGGEQVFFGKEIDMTGVFQGFLIGTYADGSLSGHLIAADGTTEESIEAKYVTGATVDSGFFQGIWQKSCE